MTDNRGYLANGDLLDWDAKHMLNARLTARDAEPIRQFLSYYPGDNEVRLGDYVVLRDEDGHAFLLTGELLAMLAEDRLQRQAPRRDPA